MPITSICNKLQLDRKGLFSQCFVLKQRRLFLVVLNNINNLADDNLNAADCDLIVCYGGAKPADKHLASRIVCIDEEIVTRLERRVSNGGGKQPPSRCRAIDNPDHDESQ
jgi:hypothetical protein